MSEENTNQQNAVSATPPQNPANHQAEAQTGEEYLFFNVAPKTAAKDQIIGPSVSVAEPAEQKNAQAENSPEGSPAKPVEESAWKKYRFYIILVIVLAIGGPGVYFGITKFGFNSYESSDLIVNDSAGTKKPGSLLPDKGNFSTPEEWRKKYFPGCSDENLCGDKTDPDKDGLVNLDESKQQTDPNNADSDGDLIADGDEIQVFGSDPLDSHTAQDPKYTDANNLTGAYDVHAAGKKMTAQQILDISAKAKQFTIHEPTLTSLAPVLEKIYGYVKPTPPSQNTASSTPTAATSTPATTTPESQIDQSPEAKQDRDAQRTNTIRTFEIALVKYQADHSEFPNTSIFQEMHAAVKPYLKIATNPVDPINKEPYIYSYSLNAKGDDFTLSFFSESANQLIKKHLADAKKDKLADEASIYDDQRKTDLANLQSALLLYSNANIAGNQDYVFPTVEKYKTELVPKYLSVIPKDPKTAKDYEYKPSEKFDTFTLKAVLDAPSAGTTGYVCNQEECRDY